VLLRWRFYGFCCEIYLETQRYQDDLKLCGYTKQTLHELRLHLRITSTDSF
jgi:hypothetical protein